MEYIVEAVGVEAVGAPRSPCSGPEMLYFTIPKTSHQAGILRPVGEMPEVAGIILAWRQLFDAMIL
jgi:hypothetical protein